MHGLELYRKQLSRRYSRLAWAALIYTVRADDFVVTADLILRHDMVHLHTWKAVNL